MRSDMDHTVLPANYTMPAFTPQPQSITALWLVLIYRPTEGRRLTREAEGHRYINIRIDHDHYKIRWRHTRLSVKTFEQKLAVCGTDDRLFATITFLVQSHVTQN